MEVTVGERFGEEGIYTSEGIGTSYRQNWGGEGIRDRRTEA